MHLRNPQVINRLRIPSSTVPKPCVVPMRTSVRVSAKRVQIDRDYPYAEVYEGVIGKLRDRNHLSVRDMTQLIECIKTPDQAGRCLDILAAYLTAKAAQATASLASIDGEDATSTSAGAMEQWLMDWPVRKRFLARIAEISVLELQRPEIAFAILSNTDRFKLSTYFGKDLILQLGRNGAVPLDILSQCAMVVQQTRGPSDRGTKGALQALLQISQDRGSNTETISEIKRQIKALSPEANFPAVLPQVVTAPARPAALQLV